MWRPPTPTVALKPIEDPSFHQFASEWFEGKRPEFRPNTARSYRPNTARSYRNDLTNHLLPFFAEHRLSQITPVEVDRYKQAQVREGRLSARSVNLRCSRRSWKRRLTITRR